MRCNAASALQPLLMAVRGRQVMEREEDGRMEREEDERQRGE